jgi:hypothetical protein
MAQIREFNSRQEMEGFNPGDPAHYFAEAGAFTERTFASVGEKVGGAINVIESDQAKRQKEADDAAYQKEVVQGALSEAKLQMSLNSQWADIQKNTDPNDWDKARAGFLENTVTPALEQYQNQFETDRGKVHGAESVARMTEEFYRTTAADSSKGAAYAVTSNLNTYVNTKSQTVYEHPDTLDSALQGWDSTLGGVIASSAVSGEEAAKMGADLHAQAAKSLVTAAINGAINNDPVKAYKALDTGAYDKYAPILGADGLEAAKTKAKEAIKAQTTEANANDAAVRKQQEDASKDASASLILNSYDENGKLQIQDNYARSVISDPTILTRDKPAVIEALTRLKASGAAKETTPGLMQSLLARAQLPEGSPDKLTRGELLSYVGNGTPTGKTLTTGDYDFIDKILDPHTPNDAAAGKLYETNLKYAAAQINPKGGGFAGLASAIGPNGDAAEAQMERDAQLAYQAGIAANKTPQQLLTPSSPDFIFSDKFIAQYKKLAAQGGAGVPNLFGNGGGGILGPNP